ncbi:hypothetical protein D5S17_08600 [Pseudonocardiaceae bacterium YIM PH 21723]|nr:hypothetical protein D5S17_08600 [Pseudonocardiaceae bacterium YIM PH 21723]
MLDWIAEQWDSFELWIVQLWFPVQIALVILVLLPACWGIAAVLDRGVDNLAGALPARRKDEQGS